MQPVKLVGNITLSARTTGSAKRTRCREGRQWKTTKMQTKHSRHGKLMDMKACHTITYDVYRRSTRRVRRLATCRACYTLPRNTAFPLWSRLRRSVLSAGNTSLFKHLHTGMKIADLPSLASGVAFKTDQPAVHGNAPNGFGSTCIIPPAPSTTGLGTTFTMSFSTSHSQVDSASLQRTDDLSILWVLRQRSDIGKEANMTCEWMAHVYVNRPYGPVSTRFDDFAAADGPDGTPYIATREYPRYDRIRGVRSPGQLEQQDIRKVHANLLSTEVSSHGLFVTADTLFLLQC